MCGGQGTLESVWELGVHARFLTPMAPRFQAAVAGTGTAPASRIRLLLRKHWGWLLLCYSFQSPGLTAKPKTGLPG